MWEAVEIQHGKLLVHVASVMGMYNVNCFYTFILNKIYDEFCLKLYLFNIFCEDQQGLKFVVMDTNGIARRQNVYVS